MKMTGVLVILISTQAFSSPEEAKDAIQDYHIGMSSNNSHVIRNTLEKYLPNKDDLVYLFGAKGALLAKNFDASKLFSRLINNASSLAEKIQAKGAITKLEVEQVNRHSPHYHTFFNELALVPNEVEVFIPKVEYEKKSGGPFRARVVILPNKVLFLVGFEWFVDAANELNVTSNSK